MVENFNVEETVTDMQALHPEVESKGADAGLSSKTELLDLFTCSFAFLRAYFLLVFFLTHNSQGVKVTHSQSD